MRQLKLIFLFLLLIGQCFGQMSVTPVMQGFTPSLVLDFTRGTLPVGLTFSRSSIATRVNAQGLIETVAADQPRFDYDPVTLQARGILIEEARTNLMLRSEQLDDASWTKSSVTVTADAIASPSGTLTADQVTATSVGQNTGLINRIISGLNFGTYTLSVYVKKGTATAVSFQPNSNTDGISAGIGASFNLNTKAVNTSSYGGKYSNLTGSIIDVGNGWYRCILTYTYAGTTPANNSSFWFYPWTSGDPPGTYSYFWGMQLEAGSFATSYIPTTSSAVTRAADVCSMTNVSWYNPAAGTWLAEYSANALNAAGVQRIISVFYQSGGYRIRTLGGAQGIYAQFTNASGTLDGNFGIGADVAGRLNKVAVSFGQSPVALSLNGSITQTSTSVALSPALNCYFGSSSIGNEVLNGYIRRVVYYPKRLPNSYLQSLTQ